MNWAFYYRLTVEHATGTPREGGGGGGGGFRDRRDGGPRGFDRYVCILEKYFTIINKM